MPDTAAPDPPLCRICYAPCCGQNECVHSPCGCKGSVGHAHAKCVRRWVLVSGNTHCHLCTQKFAVATPRPPPRHHHDFDDDDFDDDDDDDPNTLYRIDPKTFTWAIFILCLFRLFSTPD
jgi:hypothetical protein